MRNCAHCCSLPVAGCPSKAATGKSRTSILGESLISDVDRAVLTIRRQLGRKFHADGPTCASTPLFARFAAWRHRDHPQREHRDQRNQEQRIKRHVGDPLAERHQKLQQQIIAAGQMQDAPGARADRGCGAVERGRGHCDDKGIADAAEDDRRRRWWRRQSRRGPWPRSRDGDRVQAMRGGKGHAEIAAVAALPPCPRVRPQPRQRRGAKGQAEQQQRGARGETDHHADALDLELPHAGDPDA